MKENKSRIVVVDDDEGTRAFLEETFLQGGYEVLSYAVAEEALEALEGELGNAVDIVISDIKMPGIDGLELVSRLQKIRPEIPTILMTAFGSIEVAIQAIRHGAYHFVVKPINLPELVVTVGSAIQSSKLRRENAALKEQIEPSQSMGNVIGKSAEMRTVFDLVNRVSHATANIFITGESGTGKEMIARAIHRSGPRAQKPFVAINCTAIPETLLESELFGHAKGSFTGAIQRKRGLFEEADEGTLFLDEIGDMDISLQSKLLRVIQERKVRAVGDNITKDVNVRIISATHKDLRTAIKEGRFREDLFYRLSVIPIAIPPLRDRKEDIPMLADFFLKKYAAESNPKVKGFTRRAIAKLTELRWEGNVRELENVVERAVVLCSGNLIDEEDIPAFENINAESVFLNSTRDFPTLSQLEERYIQLVLEKTGRRKDRSAHILGINRRTLYRKEHEYGLSIDRDLDLDLDQADSA